MNDTYVTIRGRVGNEVEVREAGGARVASFRLASTPRLQRNGEWVDGPTSWYSVSCWRSLGAHVAESLRCGDPVVVHGRLRIESWQRADGSTGSAAAIDAGAVGHDLNWGTARFARGSAPAAAATPTAQSDAA